MLITESMIVHNSTKSTNSFISRFHYLFVAIPMVLFGCASIFVSSTRGFWYDELVTKYLIGDPSYFHMIQVYMNGVEGSFPLYYLVGWPWMKVLGASEMSMRLFSLATIIFSYFVLYGVLKKIYGFWPAFISVLIVFFESRRIFDMSYNARMYGLYLAACALGIWVLYMACKTRSQNRVLLSFLFISNAAMVLVHPFGILFSACTMAALIFHDFCQRQMRFSLYLSIVGGWLTLCLFLKAFLNFSQIFSTDYAGWIKKPTFADLEIFYGLAPYLPVFVIGIMLIRFIQTQIIHAKISSKNDGQQAIRNTMVFVSFLFLLIPLVGFVFSNVMSKSLFVERYFFPCFLAYCILLSSLLHGILKILQGNRFGKLTWAKYSVLCLISILIVRFSAPYDSFVELFPPNNKLVLTSPIDAEKYGLKNYPIISAGHYSDGVDFLPTMYYYEDKAKSRMIYLLDGRVSKALHSKYMDLQMKALGQYYFRDNIMAVQEFLVENKVFYVFRSKAWFSIRIKNNPRFKYQRVTKDLILVHRVVS